MPLSDAHTLVELLRQPDLTQNVLADRLGLTKSAVSRLVARLARSEDVSRRRDEDDGRARRLRLTSKGEKLARKLDARSLRRFATIMDRIPKAKRAMVLESLDLLQLATPAPGAERV